MGSFRREGKRETEKGKKEKGKIGFVWFFLTFAPPFNVHCVHRSEFIVNTMNSVGNCFPRASLCPTYRYVGYEGKLQK